MIFDLRRHTVIVVDDEAFTRQTVARLLTGLGATKVVQAEDGEAALAASWTIEGGPALVISDFDMPTVNGLSLLKSVRLGQSGLNRSAPFVMLTAYSEGAVVGAALELDVSAFLVKPVSRAALEKRLDRLKRVEADISWLKSIESYDSIDIEIPLESFVREDSGGFESPLPKSVKSGKAKIVEQDRKSFLGERDHEALAESLARGASSASDDGADLLRYLLARDGGHEGPVAVDESEGADAIAARLTSLRTAAPQSSLVVDVLVGTRHLIAEIGKTGTATLLSALDPLERGGILSLGDIAGCLDSGQEEPALHDRPTVTQEWREETRALGDITAGSISMQNIFTQDGHMLVAAGTELTETLIKIVAHLDPIGALDLPSDVGTGRSMIRTLVAPTPAAPGPQAPAPAPAPRPRPALKPKRATGPERAIGPTEIQAGAILSRDVHTVNGALYLSAGMKLTERHVGVLESLYEAGKLTTKIWIGA